MAEILVEPRGPREYRVRVRDRGLETIHEVVVPEDFGADNGLPPVPLERLVEVSFEFLLEHEPANSILAGFTLSEIGRYFPQYRGEIAHRLASE